MADRREPLWPPTDDFEKPLALVKWRIEVSSDSLTRVETKSSALLAGAIAVVAILFEKSTSIVDFLTLLFFLVPIRFLFFALQPRDYTAVPNAQTLRRAWPTYPKASIEAVLDAACTAADQLSENIMLKAWAVKWAIRWLFSLTVAVLLVRGVEVELRLVQCKLPVLVSHAIAESDQEHACAATHR